MKILQINSVCGFGSTGRITTEIQQKLKEKGHQSLIVYGRNNAPKDSDSYRINSSLEFSVHVLNTLLFDKHALASNDATYKLIRKIQEYSPDIIHLHNLHGFYLNIEILFEYLSRIDTKIVWTLHDCWAFTGHCAYYDYVGCEKWKTGCYDCPQKKEYPPSFYLDRSKQNYALKKNLFTQLKNLEIIVPSKWLASQVEQSFLSKYPIKVIYNGIDLNVFKPIKSNFRLQNNIGLDKKIILGVASIWEKRKGIDTFVELSKILPDEFQIVLVGVNHRQQKQLPENIIVINRTNNTNELAEIYSAADIFVNPTLEETLGLTNLEAIACGTPVITYNSGGSPECLNKDTGVVIKKKDLSSLVSAIKSPSVFEKVEIENKFDKNYALDKYLECYGIKE